MLFYINLSASHLFIYLVLIRFHAFEEFSGNIRFFCLMVYLDMMLYVDTGTVFLNKIV